MSKWSCWFEELGKEHNNLVGGKCANLGEMMKIGVRIPTGFAITTEAYDNFLEETGADREMKDYLLKFREGPRNFSEFEEVSKAIEDIIVSKEIPKAIQESIWMEYEALCQETGVSDLPVAVRSSGIAEDMPTASFAGQYESYLNVRGKDDLLEKVRLCWASAFTARGINYRVQKKLGLLGGSVSVGVQKMVNSRASGVGFTIHPVTGNDTRIILEGNWGLGESVVQGVVTPDTFVIDKKTVKLEEQEISTKLRQYSFSHRGTAEVDVPLEKQNVACISTEEAEQIAEFTKMVESHYGVPVDIEWAVDADLSFPERVFLVQARQVTVVVKKKNATDQILDMMVARFSS